MHSSPSDICPPPAAWRSSRHVPWFAAGLLLLALLLPVGALYFSKLFLCVDNGLGQTEAIVVLGGEVVYRPARALELYRQGAAPWILISGAGDWQEARIALVGKGVPPDVIELETDSKSTIQNAQYSVRQLRARGVKRAIIVTSWFHSRRALNCFRHAAPEIEFRVAPTVADQPKSPWPSKDERASVLSEYIKLLGYWVRDGIAPW